MLNNVTGDYASSTSDGTGPTTYDKIYLRSYYEMSSGLFSTGTTNQDYARRLCSPTDFALSNCAAMNASCTTTSRPSGGTGRYWLRSAGRSDSMALMVRYIGEADYNGFVVDNEGIGFRPAMRLAV